MDEKSKYYVFNTGYDKTAGTITKTDEGMVNWFNNWIDKKLGKYFSYIYNSDIKEPIGEIYYYLDNDVHSMGILIQDKYRVASRLTT